MTSDATHFEPDFTLYAEALEGGVRVLAVGGELDLATAPELEQALRRAVNEGVRRVVVDLTEVDFVDSTGIGVLADAHERLVGEGGAIAVVGAHSHVRKLFTITRLDGPLGLAHTRAEATERLIAGSLPG